MVGRSFVRRMVLLMVAGVLAGAVPRAGGEEAAWLDGLDRWRMRHSFEAPVIPDGQGGLGTLMSPFGLRERRAGIAHVLYQPAPQGVGEGWSDAEFDDSAWLAAPALRAARTPFLSALHLRGYFRTPEGEAAPELRLALTYRGGAVVYVNGREIARGHVDGDGELAAPYPAGAFLGPDGEVLGWRGDAALWDEEPDEETARRLALRDRRLEAAVPAEALRPGVNVLAIRLVRAPYHPAAGKQLVTLTYKGDHPVHKLSWNTCELRSVRLTGSPAPALEGSLRVWNSDPVAVDFDLDSGNAAEPLRPVRLAGARNGFFSGKVGVGAGEALRGLQAEVGELRGAGGIIPPDNIQVRYAMPLDSAILTNPESNELIPYAGEPRPLQALFDEPPAEVPVAEPAASNRSRAAENAKREAVTAVWVTVHVPADAAAGVYEGTLRVTAEGHDAVTVPVRLEVADWSVPDPADFTTWIELVQSPETLVLEYGLEPWSEEHLAMIEHSMQYLRAMGSSVLYAPLIAESNMGNDHSIVRWVRNGDGDEDYRFDSSVLERYLDAAERVMGPPELLVLNVWDFYLVRDDTPGRGFQVDRNQRHAEDGPKVTVLDPATGELENIVLPDYTVPEGEAPWRRLFGELRNLLRERGLEEVMVLGIASDIWPTREQVEAMNRITDNLHWVNYSHYLRQPMHDGLGPFRYHASYFNVHFNYTGSDHGWRNPVLHVLFDRLSLDHSLPVKWRGIAQQAVTANVRGVGRLGADTWMAVTDRRGRRRGRVWERFPGADWGYLNIRSSTLAPGPDGPVATTRYEYLREGVQECEARIVLERALDEAELREKLGEDLAGRCEELLREHQLAQWRGQLSWQSGKSRRFSLQMIRPGVYNLTGYLYFLDSGWQERSLDLYRLAGEVERALEEG